MSGRSTHSTTSAGLILWSHTNQQWEFWNYAERRDYDTNKNALVDRNPQAVIMEAAK